MIKEIITYFAVFVISDHIARCRVCDETYDKKIRPFNGGPPVEVHLQVYLESIGGIKDTTMDFSITMYFRENWLDPRLKFNGTTEEIFVAGGDDQFWTPDLFFLFEKHASKHAITLPNVVVKVYPDGHVFRSSRLSVTSACYMDLQRFPFDSQMCTLNAMSYSYTTKDLKLIISDKDVTVEEDLAIPSFTLKGITTKNVELSYSTAGNYSMATVEFAFQRQMQSFLLTVYIPSILLVTVAWLSFCIDAQAAPARVSLGITTVLTITTMTSGIQESLPVVTYAKAIDIWLAACLVFVFVALMEYAMANYLLLLQKKREELRKAQSTGELPTKERDSPVQKPGLDEERMSRYQTQYYSSGSKGDNTAVYGEPTSENNWPEMYWTPCRLDRLARYVYPVLFFIFNVVYWPICIWT